MNEPRHNEEKLPPDRETTKRDAPSPATAGVQRRTFLTRAAAGLGTLAACQGLALGFLRRPLAAAQAQGGSQQTGNRTECTGTTSAVGSSSSTFGPGASTSSWSYTVTDTDCSAPSGSTSWDGSNQTTTTDTYTVSHTYLNTVLTVTATSIVTVTPTQDRTFSYSCGGGTRSATYIWSPVFDDTVSRSYTDSYTQIATYTYTCDDRLVQPEGLPPNEPLGMPVDTVDQDADILDVHSRLNG